MDKCNSCSNSTTSCTCKKKPAPCSTSCSVKTSTDCVIYDANPHRSNLTCFLGVNNGTNLTKILEILDKKLCLPISKCARERFGLGSETDISMAMIKLLDYVCQMEDAKVKVSEDDTTNGYLFDKIETGDCIRKVITKDYLGVEKLKLELDFPCIESRLNCCGGNNTSISIQGTNTVCGNNTTLLTAVTNCTSTVQWSNGLTGPTIQASAGVYYATCGGRQSNTITVTSTGNCGCIPIWRDIVPVEIYCGQVLNRDNCKKYIKQSNQCNNDIQWVEYTGSSSDGSDCPGCAPTNFIATRAQTFVRQSCPSGCIPGSVTFSKNYYSTISQAVADTLATNDNNFLTEGQNHANATGTCTNCGTPTPQPLPTPLPVPIPVVIPVPSPLPTPIPLPVEPPSAVTTYTSNIPTPATFTRNNCASGCTAGSIQYSTLATSFISQVDANNKFNIAGQAAANQNGTCNCPCTLPTSVTIDGLGTVTENSTTTYTYTINGGSGYSTIGGGWSVIGGTIQSTSSNQVTITWGDNTGVLEASVSYYVYCGSTPAFGLVLVEILDDTPPPLPIETPTPVVTQTFWEIQSCPTSENGMDSGIKTTDTNLSSQSSQQRVTIGSNEYRYLGTSFTSSFLPSNFVAGAATIVVGETGCSNIIE
jgi:hypothetical protein